MSDRPLAYFLTFTTYGTWLHGDAPGSVNHDHNEFGTPFIEPDAALRSAVRFKMAQEPLALDEPCRGVVRDAIIAECRFRGWHLLALHVRSNHVHAVIAAGREPEFVMRSCKAHASKCLTKAGFDNRDRKRWTEHGSTRYLWHEDAVSAAAEYTLNRQGEPMAVYDPKCSDPNRSPSASEDFRG
ncbi:MAG TPA: hypothetical protein VMZ71_07810 [Gemmataceae bacterium]|nr:hypothetical protein [Gemmataceae bacterium]